MTLSCLSCLVPGDLPGSDPAILKKSRNEDRGQGTGVQSQGEAFVDLKLHGVQCRMRYQTVWFFTPPSWLVMAGKTAEMGGQGFLGDVSFFFSDRALCQYCS